ncbi:SDR family NAD(P)-dependent oxidoreductase [Limobrevibacterium gyesilva]|uniref:SDR family oxidoreductase n=1 Tax=Limobrevibacterium gyesilva TaxID=2991712 RepID=A0AA42CF44_9PROT|nr:SDR family oxidoreductase [Limobrevibacterium gyesilva]MCW3474376.1 SDR family oxidoreductase [Limobrevibacterium gyesilva]
MSTQDLAGTTALVMGASAGIGAAVAEALAARGAAIGLVARRRKPIEALAARLRAGGAQAVPLVCDVADHAAVAATVQAAVDHFGRLDHLINNAGVIQPIGRLHETDPAQWAQAVQINLTGVFNACHAALPHLLARGGTIVNVSSGAAHRPLEGWSAYCSSKAGVAMLTRALMLEYGAEGLRVYGFAPGTVRTAMQVAIRASGINPVSRLDPESLIPAAAPAQIIAWLCTPDAADFPSGEHSIRDAALRARAALQMEFAD